MPLKKSTGNMYSFITHTWNPVRGKCGYKCHYCYVSKWGKEIPLHIDEKEMKIDLGSGNFIFICSGCDLFHPDVPDHWISSVIFKTGEHPENDYLWHTKNPGRIVEKHKWYGFDEHDVVCATIESNIPWPGISLAPQPFDRVEAMKHIKGRKMITVEPVMEFDVMTFSEMLISCEPEQVNIGADSGRFALPEPSRVKLENLIELLALHTKVHLKTNLKRLLPEHDLYGRDCE